MNIKIKDKNGITLKTKGKYVTEDIAVGIDESLLGGEGATITTKDTWQGTPVPASGTFAGNTLYFNKNITAEEFYNIAKNLTYLDMNSELKAYLIHGSSLDLDAGIFYGIYYYPNDDLYILMMILDTAQVEMLRSDSGWGKNIVGEVDQINYPNTLEEFASAFGIPIQNDKLSSLVSITPFSKVGGEEVKLEGEYGGSTLVIEDISKGYAEGGKLAFPNTGYVEHMHVNTDMTQSEVKDTLGKITGWLDTSENQDGSSFVYAVLYNSVLALFIVKMGSDYMMQALLTEVGLEGTIYDDTQGGWLSDGIEFVETYLEKWEVGEVFSNVEGTPVGTDNDKLVDLFYTLPKPNTIDMKSLINSKKIPLEIEVKGGGEANGLPLVVEELPIKWQGTAVPNTGTLSEVYFNTALSVNEVVSLLEQLTFEKLSPSEDTLYNFILSDITQSGGSIAYMVSKDPNNNAYKIFNYMNSKEFFSSDNGWNLESFTDTNRISFNEPINVATSFMGAYAVGAENDKISSLFSTTPFVENEIVEGSYYKTNSLSVYFFFGDEAAYIDEMMGATPKIIKVKDKPTTDIIVSNEETGVTLYYVENDNDIFMYGDLQGTGTNEWLTIGMMFFGEDGFFKGTIQDISEVNEPGYYITYKTSNDYKYTNNKFVEQCDITYKEMCNLLLEGDTTREEFIIPKNTKIRNYCFAGLVFLNKISYEDITTNSFTYTTPSHVFRDSGIKDIELPPGEYPLGEYMFFNCGGLTKVYLHAGITSLESNCFFNCVNLEVIDMANVSRISYMSFGNCHSLKKIIIRHTDGVCVLSSDTFNLCYHLTGYKHSTFNPNGDKDGYIYVPDNLVDSYKTATNWSTYASQIKPLSEYVED